MIINEKSVVPIYLQIAKGIEDDILNDILKVNESAYSQYQLAERFQINPATAAKGIGILVEKGILLKRRGLGMLVSIDAKEIIKKERKQIFLDKYVKPMIKEAKRIGIEDKDIIQMMKKAKGGGLK